MDDIKLFGKYEKESETLIQAVWLYSLDIRMEFGIEKCAILITESRKPQMMEGIEQPNQNKIRTLGEKETHKYLAMLESGTIKHAEMKEKKKKKKENLKRTRIPLEIKLYCRNIIEVKNTWCVHLVR